MARVFVGEGSRQMAHNNSDLQERWEEHRAALTTPQERLSLLAQRLGVTEDDALEFSLWLVGWASGDERNGVHALYTRYLHIVTNGEDA